jgi:hypothetical protein
LGWVIFLFQVFDLNDENQMLLEDGVVGGWFDFLKIVIKLSEMGGMKNTPSSVVRLCSVD